MTDPTRPTPLEAFKDAAEMQAFVKRLNDWGGGMFDDQQMRGLPIRLKEDVRLAAIAITKLHATNRPTPSMDGRAEFEKRAQSLNWDVSRHSKDYGPWKKGDYINTMTAQHWATWQARTPPAGEAVVVPRDIELLGSTLHSAYWSRKGYNATTIGIAWDTDAAKREWHDIAERMIFTLSTTPAPASPAQAVDAKGAAEEIIRQSWVCCGNPVTDPLFDTAGGVVIGQTEECCGNLVPVRLSLDDIAAIIGRHSRSGPGLIYNGPERRGVGPHFQAFRKDGDATT